MDFFDKLTISQLDKQIQTSIFREAPYPKEGWIKLCRKALKMSTNSLAKRLGISQPGVHALEKREAEKNISLKNLEKIAQGLGCRLVYFFVPETTFMGFIENEQLRIAQRLLERVQKTMALEDQALTKEQKKEQLKLILEDIQKDPLKKLWNYHEI